MRIKILLLAVGVVRLLPVHRVELRLTGLSLEEVVEWIASINLPSEAPAEEIHRATGGHPLAVELLELYGQTLHDDWLRFLDEEILDVLPEERVKRRSSRTS